jgi:hypothetical protein
LTPFRLLLKITARRKDGASAAQEKKKGEIQMTDHVRVSARIARSVRGVQLFVGSLLAVVASPAFTATTYTYSGAPNYSIFTNFTPPCTIASCTNYTTAMTLSGSFTTATALAPNLVNQDIAAQITTYSFSDGINTYEPTNGRIIEFHVYTDASGVPTSSTFFEIQEWITGSSPHTSSDRFSDVSVDFSATVTNNISCSSVGTTTGGTADACLSSGTDSNSSNAQNDASGAWSGGSGPPPPPTKSITPVPTLSTLALGLLATLVIGLGWFQLRRRRQP